jgi:hypothetical protein
MKCRRGLGLSFACLFRVQLYTIANFSVVISDSDFGWYPKAMQLPFLSHMTHLVTITKYLSNTKCNSVLMLFRESSLNHSLAYYHREQFL